MSLVVKLIMEDLNTSYVDIKLTVVQIIVKIIVYLNTSYVDIKPNELKIKNAVLKFKYILC